MTDRPPSGHRSVPHTADVRIEAWALSREQCVAEAIMAMVQMFTDASGVSSTGSAQFRVEPGSDKDMLVAALDEVIFRMDTEGRLPMDASVTVLDDGGLEVWTRVTETNLLRLIGAVPKAVSWHDLRFGADENGWSCGVTLDV